MKRTWQEFLWQGQAWFQKKKIETIKAVFVYSLKHPPRSNETLVLKWAPMVLRLLMASPDGEAENNNNTSSRVLLIPVRGSHESLSSRTTFILFSKAGSIHVNFIMCPGNHEGGPGSAER